MDSKLIELSNEMQEKTEQQLDDMKQDYFAYAELKDQVSSYRRAKINCGIAYDSCIILMKQLRTLKAY